MTLDNFPHQLFDALRHATFIRTSARIKSTKEARALIRIALDGFQRAFGCAPTHLTPIYNDRAQLIAIEACGRHHEQVWKAAQTVAA
jgi:hypothetical protein